MLFVSAVLALISGLVGINYPGNAIFNVCLWVALVMGSLITTQNKFSGSGNGWVLGLSLGLVYSVLVIMLTMIVQRVAQVEGQTLSDSLIVPFYELGRCRFGRRECIWKQFQRIKVLGLLLPKRSQTAPFPPNER